MILSLPIDKILSAPRFDINGGIKILFGSDFSDTVGKRWFIDHQPFIYQICIVYLIVIFGLREIMRNRRPFDLFIPLNLWNFGLAAFSIVCTYKLTNEFFTTIADHGLEHSYCKIGRFTEGNNGYWAWVFMISKLFELVDTVFLVLRKRPLLFLHWYHHVLTLIFSFNAYPMSPGYNRWGIYLNTFVHSFMYSYYFVRSMKFRVPGIFAQFITTIQILQFIISCAILAHVYILISWYRRDCDCDINSGVFQLTVFMDVTYLLLFLQFFFNAYVSGGGRNKYRTTNDNTIHISQRPKHE